MSEVKIRRKSKGYAVTLYTAVASCQAIPVVDMAGGIVSMGTTSSNVSALHVYASDSEDGTYARLHDSVGSPANVTLNASTAVSQAYALPDAVFGAHWIKLASSTTNSTGIVATVTMKG
jgi:hypothetical protein